MVQLRRNEEVISRDADSVPLSFWKNYFAGLDYLQLGALLFLLGTGLLFIYSTGEQVGTELSRSFFYRQLQWIGLGGGLWFFFSLVNFRSPIFKVGIILFFLASLALLALVLVAGVRIYGATRWLNIGGFRLQPSELTKLALTCFLALLYSTKLFSARKISGVIVGLLSTLIPFVLIAKEPDLGSAILLLPIFGAILFTAGLKWRYLFIAVILFGVLGGGFVFNEFYGKPLLRDYQRNRIRTFLNPQSDIRSTGYNAHQAKLAVGSGGAFGKGIGAGTQHALGFLPQTVSNNDFIFSVIAEETGFAGALTLLGGYLVLLFSIFRTAFRAESFLRLTAVGIGTIFFVHMFINIGMSIGVTPVTGLPLPFVSYGGSFTLMGMAALGVLSRPRLNAPTPWKG